MTDKERERLSEQLLNYRTAQGVVDRLDAAEALVREVEKQLFTEVETEARPQDGQLLIGVRHFARAGNSAYDQKFSILWGQFSVYPLDQTLTR